jgi:CheY-like chemotaxis protein
MPRVGGLALLPQIREIEPRPPVIVISATSEMLVAPFLETGRARPAAGSR